MGIGGTVGGGTKSSNNAPERARLYAVEHALTRARARGATRGRALRVRRVTTPRNQIIVPPEQQR